jgi:hypothetical protein
MPRIRETLQCRYRTLRRSRALRFPMIAPNRPDPNDLDSLE